MALAALNDPDILALLYGGAKGGGKSVFGCLWMWRKCLQIIKQFNLMPTPFPTPIGFMGRKQSVDFTNTTLETWKQFIPFNTFEIKAGDKEIVILDTLKINYGGFDSSDSVKKFNSAEYAYLFIDQAEEISRDDYGLARGTLRRKIQNTPLDYKVLLTANPADCWLRDDFISGGNKANAFIKALPADNPFLPVSYIDNLKEAFKHRPELIDAYVYGSWDIISGFDLIIKPSWVENSLNREQRLSPISEKVIISCDPARFGDDETVIYVLRGNRIIAQTIYGKKDTMITAGHCVALAQKYGAELIAVDGDGVGGGVVDRIRELKYPVLEINGQKNPDNEKDHARYTNTRSQMWWEGGLKFAEEEVTVPDDKLLQRQLCNCKYEMSSSGKVKAERKDEIKKRSSGKSPDRADAFLMGLFALKHVPGKAKDFNRRQPQRAGNPYGWDENLGGLHNVSA